MTIFLIIYIALVAVTYYSFKKLQRRLYGPTWSVSDRASVLLLSLAPPIMLVFLFVIWTESHDWNKPAKW